MNKIRNFFHSQFGAWCAVALILATGVAVIIAGHPSRQPLSPVPHMPVPKSMPDAEMLDTIKHAPVGALLSYLSTFYIMCLGFALLFAMPFGKPFLWRFRRYLVVSCGFAAALQAIFLYGLGTKIFAAIWSHMLKDATNLRQAFIAYLLAAIVVLGVAEIALRIALLPRSIYRLIQTIKKLPVPFQKPSRGECP